MITGGSVQVGFICGGRRPHLPPPQAAFLLPLIPHFPQAASCACCTARYVNCSTGKLAPPPSLLATSLQGGNRPRQPGRHRGACCGRTECWAVHVQSPVAWVMAVVVVCGVACSGWKLRPAAGGTVACRPSMARGQRAAVGMAEVRSSACMPRAAEQNAQTEISRYSERCSAGCERLGLLSRRSAADLEAAAEVAAAHVMAASYQPPQLVPTLVAPPWRATEAGKRTPLLRLGPGFALLTSRQPYTPRSASTAGYRAIRHVAIPLRAAAAPSQLRAL